MSPAVAQSPGAERTADDVLEGVDLRGRRVLVTGVSSGLGVETARVLAAHGAEVVGAARDLDKARRATAAAPGVELVELDLARLASVQTCVEALLKRGAPLDLVIANAGVMMTPFGLTPDGFETQFATNHLGHFALVNQVAPLLGAGGRVVVLTSGGHRAGDVDLDDANFERTPYDGRTAYGRSKTANILFAVEFDRRHRGRGVRAAAVHPGTIDTDLSRHLTAEAKAQMISAINASHPPGAPEFRYKTVGQGVATTVWAGVTAEAAAIGGRYCENCQVAEVLDTPGARTGVRSYALDPDRAKALWDLSEEMVGRRF